MFIKLKPYLSLLVSPALAAGGDAEDVPGCGGELSDDAAARGVLQPHQAGLTVDQTILGHVVALRHHQVVPAHAHVNNLGRSFCSL